MASVDTRRGFSDAHNVFGIELFNSELRLNRLVNEAAFCLDQGRDQLELCLLKVALACLGWFFAGFLLAL